MRTNVWGVGSVIPKLLQGVSVILSPVGKRCHKDHGLSVTMYPCSNMPANFSYYTPYSKVMRRAIACSTKHPLCYTSRFYLKIKCSGVFFNRISVFIFVYFDVNCTLFIEQVFDFENIVK